MEVLPVNYPMYEFQRQVARLGELGASQAHRSDAPRKHPAEWDTVVQVVCEFFVSNVGHMISLKARRFMKNWKVVPAGSLGTVSPFLDILRYQDPVAGVARELRGEEAFSCGQGD